MADYVLMTPTDGSGIVRAKVSGTSLSAVQIGLIVAAAVVVVTVAVVCGVLFGAGLLNSSPNNRTTTTTTAGQQTTSTTIPAPSTTLATMASSTASQATSAVPATTGTSTRAATATTLPPLTTAPTGTTVPPDITVTVSASTIAISPYIYGINSLSGIPNAPKATIDRAGGNRWTAYNWEDNFSNAGSDYGPYSSDTYLSTSTVPAEAIRPLVAADKSVGVAMLMTVQLQGYCSADNNGNVDVSVPLATRLANRFKEIVFAKGSAFTVIPSTTDAFVYMDEFVWAMDQKFGGQNIFSGGSNPVFVSLDNEPELWSSTHLEVQGPSIVAPATYIARAIDLAKALKTQFPQMTIFAPAHYGFQGIYSWQGSISATPGGSNWFPDLYLAQASAASVAFGKPLLDVYDFHWYPEIYDSGGARTVNMAGTTLTPAQVQLIVQSPRDLWDSTWTNPSNSNNWIFNTLGAPIQILNRLKAKIASSFPSVKLSVSEYQAGGYNHISGTVAQADQLGVFAAQGVFSAHLWPPNGSFEYTLAGFRAFRSFDGAGINFGDIYVASSSSDVSRVTVHVSKDSTKAGRVVMVCINRDVLSRNTLISGIALSGAATLFRITALSAAGQSPIVPVNAGTVPIAASSITVNLPAMSVTTINIE